jgi:hypothetical protein
MDGILDNIQVPTETNMQEIVNRAINTAIPALVMAVAVDPVTFIHLSTVNTTCTKCTATSNC